MRHGAIIAIVFGLVWAFAPSFPGPPEACTLLTLADVSSALGTGYAVFTLPGISSTTAESSECTYTKGAGTGNAVSLLVLAAPDSDAKATVAARQARMIAGHHQVTPLEGLCEAAYYDDASPLQVKAPFQAQLVFAKGPWQLFLQVNTGGKPDMAAAQALAGVVCSRLP